MKTYSERLVFAVAANIHKSEELKPYKLHFLFAVLGFPG
jgi:hypothetical protein